MLLSYRKFVLKGLNENTLCLLIVCQCILFVFSSRLAYSQIIESLQLLIDCIFVFDLTTKLANQGKQYLRKPLNLIDSAVVVASFVGHFITHDGQTLTALRVIRLLRLLKVIKLIPHSEQIFVGVGRAMKASKGVFLMLAVLVTFFSILGFLLFNKTLPSHFEDPLIASYTVFSLFTVEGWNELPSLVPVGTLDFYLIRAYVISVIVFGSFFALSLANAIFIDEIVMDNNNELEKKVDTLSKQIERQNMLIQKLTKKLE